MSMICTHCGGTIQYGTKICPLCREKMDFSERLSYEPTEAPLAGAESAAAPGLPAMPETQPGPRKQGLHKIREIFHQRIKRGRGENGQ